MKEIGKKKIKKLLNFTIQILTLLLQNANTIFHHLQCILFLNVHSLF